MKKLNMKTAIWGIGKSGISALRLALKKNLDVILVNSGDVDLWYSEALPLEKKFCYSEENIPYDNIFEIVLSPGIPSDHKALIEARKKGISLISEIEFAYGFSPKTPIIAVTGTNGKTTTVTMIYELLKLSGRKVFCGGNIGRPFCELALLDEIYDWAVIEVSSFQLEAIKTFHPQIAVILNISPNHSERYQDVEDYARAKFRISLNMTNTDKFILGEENPFLHIQSNEAVRKSYFSRYSLPERFLKTFDFSQMKILGSHNVANFYVAYEVLNEVMKSEQEFKRDDLFQNFLNQFKGVPHRLEYVNEFQGLKVFNDAKSTNLLSTIAALESFPLTEKKIILILGGKLRDQSENPDFRKKFEPFKNRINKILLIGESASWIMENLSGEFEFIELKTLEKIKEYVNSSQEKGVLLFSPGFPSFDQFKNYLDRGETFKRLFST